MSRKTFQAIILILSVVMFIVPSQASAKDKLTDKTVELRLALRSLWTGHIFWVRNVVLTTKYGDPDAAKVEEAQVVQNAKDLANSIAPYYGKEAADKLFGLLAGHYGAIKEYMTATFSDNKEAKDAAAAKLKKNADEIATFLSSANPKYWLKEALLSALVAHGGHHMADINEINKKDFSAEAETWNAMQNHIYVIADVLANGIVQQFPKKF